MSTNKAPSSSDLSSLSAEELRLLMQAQLDAEEPDPDLLRNIAAVLESRDPLPFDPDAAFRSLLQDHLEADPLLDPGPETVAPPRRRRSRLVRAAAVAAVIALVLLGGTFAAQALGFDLWDMVTRWSSDTFSLSSPHGDDREAPIDTEDDYAVLRETLRNAGVSQPVVPHFLPAGYLHMETAREDSFEGVTISSVYKSDSGTILLTYIIVQTEDPMRYYPVDDSEPEIYTVNGVDHYITTNEGRYRAFWTCGNLVCSVSGLTERAELIRMIESIYWEDSQ